ncbi:hypothetical protein [Acinetobacter sp.]|uniref:hypothetical protein n=1 Tax=Acinetobacter sp. TaxID=472 RepID=UPI0028B07AF8|nr:hypothetical protein [Acinetobacter sp.]
MTQKSLSIATVAIGVLTTVNAMDAVEVQAALTGTAKKQAVLAFIKSLVIDLGHNWDVYEQLTSTFIDQIKTAYNAVKDLFK